MSPLNYIEVQMLCEELNKLSGTQLQRVSSDENKIYLLFWDGKESYSWFLDLNLKSPVCLPAIHNNIKKNIKKPWVNFLDMHFRGSILVEASLVAPGERSLVLNFTNVDMGKQKIIINLFPRGVNLILQSQGKQVSQFKVKDFPPVSSLPEGLKQRTIAELIEEYSKKKSSNNKNKLDPKQLYDKEVKKVNKSIIKTSEDIEDKKVQIKSLKLLGEQIKAKQSLAVEKELLKFINPDLTVFENMNSCFEQSKKIKSKIEGSQQRLSELKLKQEQLLQVNDIAGWAKSRTQNTTNQLKLKKDQKLKFKTINLDSDHKVLLGSSAKNNSDLIKASKPWYIWMHLRDYPSSHAVIICEKNKPPARSILIKASEELVKHNFKAKKIKYEGLKFDLIYCEIRHLKQIKSSPGKVTYSKDKNINVQM